MRMPKKNERVVLATLLAGQISSLVMILGFFIFLFLLFRGLTARFIIPATAPSG